MVFRPRLEQEITLVRWGHWGQPVLVFPTAGGDAEEIERMQLDRRARAADRGGPDQGLFLRQPRRARASPPNWGSVEYRCALLEPLRGLRRRRRWCRRSAPTAATTASRWSRPAPRIGAFKAVAVTCRYPWLFRAAIGMSGTYDLERLFGFQGTDGLLLLGAAQLPAEPRRRARSSTQLRRRFIVLAFGQGRWEDPDEAWRMAGVLGAKGMPNRVDPWGPDYDHDWPTWRQMLPRLPRRPGALSREARTMNVIFLEPGFPANQREFVRALASVGAHVIGVGERPYDWLDDELKGWLGGYQQIASVTDEGALEWAVREVAEPHVDRPAGGGGRGARAAGGACARALHAFRASRRAPPISAATRWR